MAKSRPDPANGNSTTDAAGDLQATELKPAQARVVAKRKAAEQLFSDLHVRLLTDSEVGAYFGKSARTIRRFANERKIPSVRMGRGRRYRLGDIEKALRRYEIREVSL